MLIIVMTYDLVYFMQIYVYDVVACPVQQVAKGSYVSRSHTFSSVYLFKQQL